MSSRDVLKRNNEKCAVKGAKKLTVPKDRSTRGAAKVTVSVNYKTVTVNKIK